MATGSDRRERSGRSHRRRRGASVDALPLLLGGGAAVRKDPRRLGGGTGLVVAAVGALALWGLARRVGQEGGVGSVVRHRTAGHAGRGGGRGRGNAHTAHKDSAGMRAAALLAAGGGAVKMPATYAEMFGDGSAPRKAVAPPFAAAGAAVAPAAASVPESAAALPPSTIHVLAPVAPGAPADAPPAAPPPPASAEVHPLPRSVPPLGAPLPPPPPPLALVPASVGTPPTAGAARGAAAPGRDQNFWAWFQATKAGDAAAARPTTGGALPCPPPGEPSARLCATFYKAVRKYKVRRVVDISCAANVGWMRAVVARLGGELWGFLYVCMAAEAEETAANEAAFAAAAVADARAAGEGTASGTPAVPSWMTFETRRWWKEGFGGAPPAEAGSAAAAAVAASAAAAADPAGGGGGTGDVGLVFAWDVLAHTPYGRVWGFFVRARVDGVGLVLFDNYPGLVNNPSPRRRYLNVRKHPFRFGQATEVVQNVTEGSGEAVRRQMLLYKVSTLPELLTGKG